MEVVAPLVQSLRALHECRDAASFAAAHAWLVHFRERDERAWDACVALLAAPPGAADAPSLLFAAQTLRHRVDGAFGAAPREARERVWRDLQLGLQPRERGLAPAE